MKSSENSDSGTIIGGVSLVAGCCIGAGMLGLPVISAITGFRPSILMFLISWMFMLTTGLLFLETALSFRGETHLVSMANRVFGSVGKAIAWTLFLFLFYSLLVAYIAGSGSLLLDFSKHTFEVTFPSWIGQLLCTLFFGLFLYRGTQATDYINRCLMAGLLTAYFFLLGLGAPHVEASGLEQSDWSKAYCVLPVMIVSFGFHNLVPSLTTYLKHDVKKLKKTLVIGSIIPLIIYLLWEWLVLGLVPLEGNGGFRETLDNGQLVTQAIRNAVGLPFVADVAQLFAFFTIVTSLITVALSFIDFLADGLHIQKDHKGRALLCFLVLTPPFLCAAVYPHIFHIALSYGGGIGAVLLFGIFPAAMVWKTRYLDSIQSIPIVPGGKPLLILIMSIACAVVLMQIFCGGLS
jgi:tyrosine-specific transport protein